MKQVTITNLQTDSRVFSVQGDVWNADVVRNQSVRIYGTDANRVTPREFDRTYQIGDRAVSDSYNLIYTGEIVSITDKTVTLRSGSGNKRLSLAMFVAYNRDRSIEEVDAYNDEESKYI